MQPKTLGDASFLESLKPDVTDILKELKSKIDKLVKIRKDIKFMEDKLAKANKDEASLSSEDIPNLLLSRGLSELKLDSGEKIIIKEKLFASVPKEQGKQKIVISWLIENGGAYLVKKELKVEDPEEHILNYLKEQGIGFSNELSVNTNSFRAFLNEKLGMKKGSLPVMEIGEIPKQANPFIHKETKIS